jgi:hypothetical protein
MRGTAIDRGVAAAVSASCIRAYGLEKYSSSAEFHSQHGDWSAQLADRPAAAAQRSPARISAARLAAEQQTRSALGTIIE